MAAALSESHSAERRQSPSTCCCWLAEHRQRVHQTGSQEYKIIAYLLPMILVGRASFFGAQESRSLRWRKPRGTRASTSNFRAVPGRTATTDKTLKAAAVGGSRVNTRSSSSFSPTIYTDTRQNSSRKNKEGCNTLTWDAATTGCTEEVQSVDAGYGRLLKLVGGGEGS